MLTSMTGFSRSARKKNGFSVSVEMRSLNNRYLEISVKIPRRFSALEEDIRNCVRKNVSRGKVDVFILLDGVSETIENISLNLNLAKKYIDSFKTLETTFNVPVSFNTESLLSIENLFEHKISSEQIEFLHSLILKTVQDALKELIKHRREEGKNLGEDFRERLTVVAQSLQGIKRVFKSRRKEDFDKLRKRIESTLKNVEKIDPQRLEMEAAVMADKFDISEECVRLDSHLKMFKDSLSDSSSVGRRLEFILQEINRETNTISAKSNNIHIAQEVVKIKEEIERFKEQVRNIE